MAKSSSAKHASETPREREHSRESRALRSVDNDSSDRDEAGALSLDRLIHERMRLGIVSALAVNDTLSFNELKHLLDTTDGNLSVHARRLEDAGYVHCDKTFAGRTPRTDYKLTAVGRRAFEKYLDHMDALIRATRKKS